MRTSCLSSRYTEKYLEVIVGHYTEHCHPPPTPSLHDECKTSSITFKTICRYPSNLFSTGEAASRTTYPRELWRKARGQE